MQSIQNDKIKSSWLYQIGLSNYSNKLSTIKQKPFMITKKNPSNFRQLIMCSILADQPLTIEQINMNRNPPGLKPQQSRFLQLIQSISNGSKSIVTKGGCLLKFYPGLVTNNQGVQTEFDCGRQRSIVYYLQYLFLIAIFGKTSLNIILTGVTNTNYDNCIDSFQNQVIPFLKKHYGFDNQLTMKILKRGYFPQGSGKVSITIPAMRKLSKINLQEKGYIHRIRGVCAGSKISSSILNNIVSKCRNVFNDFIPDVWIHTDFDKGEKASNSPGYSLSLQAQSKTGSMIAFEGSFQAGDPDKFAEKISIKLLDEIKYSGVISTNYQWLILNMMAFSERKTSSVKLGRISPFTIECLRILKDFLGVIFEIEESQSQNLAIFRCIGSGFENYARVVK